MHQFILESTTILRAIYFLLRKKMPGQYFIITRVKDLAALFQFVLLVVQLDLALAPYSLHLIQ